MTFIVTIFLLLVKESSFSHATSWVGTDRQCRRLRCLEGQLTVLHPSSSPCFCLCLSVVRVAVYKCSQSSNLLWPPQFTWLHSLNKTPIKFRTHQALTCVTLLPFNHVLPLTSLWTSWTACCSSKAAPFFAPCPSSHLPTGLFRSRLIRHRNLVRFR